MENPWGSPWATASRTPSPYRHHDIDPFSALGATKGPDLSGAGAWDVEEDGFGDWVGGEEVAEMEGPEVAIQEASFVEEEETEGNMGTAGMLDPWAGVTGPFYTPEGSPRVEATQDIFEVAGAQVAEMELVEEKEISEAEGSQLAVEQPPPSRKNETEQATQLPDSTSPIMSPTSTPSPTDTINTDPPPTSAASTPDINIISAPKFSSLSPPSQEEPLFIRKTRGSSPATSEASSRVLSLVNLYEGVARKAERVEDGDAEWERGREREKLGGFGEGERVREAVEEFEEMMKVEGVDVEIKEEVKEEVGRKEVTEEVVEVPPEVLKLEVEKPTKEEAFSEDEEPIVEEVKKEHIEDLKEDLREEVVEVTKDLNVEVEKEVKEEDNESTEESTHLTEQEDSTNVPETTQEAEVAGPLDEDFDDGFDDDDDFGPMISSADTSALDFDTIPVSQRPSTPPPAISAAVLNPLSPRNIQLPASPASIPPHSRHVSITRPPVPDYKNLIKYENDALLLAKFNESLEIKPTNERESPPDTMYDCFTTQAERSFWLRVSRHGSLRRHGMEYDPRYKHVRWQDTEMQRETVKIVRRWMEEGSSAGRVLKGESGGLRTGKTEMVKMFSWNDTSADDPVNLGALRERMELNRVQEEKKAPQRPLSVAVAGLERSMHVARASVGSIDEIVRGETTPRKERPMSLHMTPTTPLHPPDSPAPSISAKSLPRPSLDSWSHSRASSVSVSQGDRRGSGGAPAAAVAASPVESPVIVGSGGESCGCGSGSN